MFYFIIYNDNKHNEYLEKLLSSLKKYGKEFKLMAFNKNDIDKDFKEKNKEILNCSRGAGYWLWKPYIINKMLDTMNEGDIVFYLDSKYYFIEEIRNLYENIIKNNDIIVWKNKPNEPIWFMKNWCKMDVIEKYKMNEKIFKENAEDCWAGALIVKKTPNTIKYIKEWLEMCCIYEDITDSPSILENTSDFREHRHDQTLLSIILHKYNIEMQYFEKKYLQNIRSPY
jgi:hypothetical protein